MPTVTINGEDIEVDEGTTILQAAAQLGYDIPHFCYHPALSIPANCRMCLVEVEGEKKLQPSCYSPVNDGMVVHTESDRVIKARKAVLEFILVNHPVDCPVCDQAGECKLQDYYMAYDAQESRLRTEKQQKVKAYPIGPEVVYDGERCILCTRCVRFCEEITETDELTTVERGDATEIRTFPGKELDNNYSMCTVDICPVGALTSRDFRFKCRVWLLSSTESVCTGCAKGCNVHLDHFQNEIQRYRPRYNPDVNDYWMCDQGRYTYQEVHTDRLVDAYVDDEAVNWHSAGEAVSDRLGPVLAEEADQAAASADDSDEADAPVETASRVGMVVSPQSSCEDLFVARTFAEDVLETDRLYAGGKPDGASDDLLIASDKNPNTRGIEFIWGDTSSPDSFEQLVDDLEADELDVLVMTHKHIPSNDDELRSRFYAAVEQLDLFIYQAAHRGGVEFQWDHRGDFVERETELAALADIAVPVSSHAEAEGTFVNEDGLAQPFKRAFEPHGESLPEWQVYLKLAKALGEPLDYMYLNQIRDEMFDNTEAKPESLADREPTSRSLNDRAAAGAAE
jgi:NADH-quinone oxidoreductase subunit G